MNVRFTERRTAKGFVNKRFAGVILAVLVLCAVCVMPVMAGSITVDTTGLTGKVTDTILVPVVITGPKEVCAWQLDVETGDTADAKIVFNRDSVLEAGAASSDSTIYWTESSDRSKYITKDKTLFYLAVTPKREGDIPIVIKNVVVGESDADGWAVSTPYEANSGVLHVSGMGTGQTIGDSSSGATVFMSVMENGYLKTGEDSSLRSVSMDETGEVSVVVFWGTCKPYDIPSTFQAAEQFTLNLDCAEGTPMKLEIGVSKDWVKEQGKTAEDLVVIRNIYGKWYSSAITSVVEDGDYYVVTIDSWSSSTAFAVGFDSKGTTYPKETLQTVLDGGKSTDGSGEGMNWIILAVIGAVVVAGLVITAVVVSRKRKGKNNDWERL